MCTLTKQQLGIYTTYFQNQNSELGKAANAFNPNTKEREVEGLCESRLHGIRQVRDT